MLTGVASEKAKESKTAFSRGLASSNSLILGSSKEKYWGLVVATLETTLGGNNADFLGGKSTVLKYPSLGSNQEGFSPYPNISGILALGVSNKVY